MVSCVNKYGKYIKVINLFIFFPLLQFMIKSGDKNKITLSLMSYTFTTSAVF